MKYLILVSMLLTGCSLVSYKGLPDGSTTVFGFSMGNTSSLEGGEFKLGADKSRSLRIDKVNRDQVEGLKEINQGISLIIEGAAKGAKP